MSVISTSISPLDFVGAAYIFDRDLKQADAAAESSGHIQICIECRVWSD